MSGSSGGDAHVRDSLGLYLLDALPEAERDAVETHLARCLPCCAEAAELGPVVEALTLLPGRDIRELVADYGFTAPPTPLPTADRAVDGGSPTDQPATDRRVRPGDARPAGRPGRGAGRRTRIPLGLVLLAAVLVLSVGVVLGLTLAGPAGDSAPVRVTLVGTATAAGSASGASVSVYVTGDRQGSRIRATVAGLQDGVRYQLYAVTVDGRTSVVCQWLGSPDVRDLTGVLPVAVDSLAFFTVTRTDGTPVVSAYLPRSRVR